MLLTLVFKSTAVDGGYPCCLGNERLTASENVRDLGVVVDSQLCFSEHIANIVRKAHQRANLVHRCFTSKNPDLLVKAFKVYVRPILDLTVRSGHLVFRRIFSLSNPYKESLPKEFPACQV